MVKVVAAYLLANLAGAAAPTEADIKKILGAGEFWRRHAVLQADVDLTCTLLALETPPLWMKSHVWLVESTAGPDAEPPGPALPHSGR